MVEVVMVEVRGAGEADDVDTTAAYEVAGEMEDGVEAAGAAAGKEEGEAKLLLLPKKLGGEQLALVLLLPLLAYGDVCQLEGVEGGHLEGQGEQKRRQWRFRHSCRG